MKPLEESTVGVVGLGYVGLPLALEFGKQFPTVGFDINTQRISELNAGKDRTLEVRGEDIRAAERLSFSSALDSLAACNIYVVTVPTPIDRHKRPDLSPLEAASRTVGKVLKNGDVVVFESTVYPGCSEEICVPIMAAESGLRFNEDFYLGYSPERINPGDKEHSVTSILKVTSGSTPQVADYVDALYRRVIKAGTHKASSIQVAEAAKVIENTQRDVNIALINELALLFNRLNIDTLEVLQAAGTKWNFLPFRPGLVGGHCIGVDPYYLTHKAREIGFNPEMILAGRRINDEMGAYIAQRVVKLLAQRRIHIAGANILILGLAFKENCPDIRNTRVVDLVNEFESYHANIDIHDPWVDPEEAKHEYGIELAPKLGKESYDAVILAVAHHQFRAMGIEKIRELGKPKHVLYDVKHMLPQESVDGRL